MKKQLIFIPVLLFSFFSIFAQQRDLVKEYEDFKNQSEQKYSNFRDSINASFAEFMRKSWEAFDVLPPVPAPQSPEPEKPVVADPKEKPTSEPLPFDKITPLPLPTPRPEPLAPIPPSTPETTAFSFLFYNTECKVNTNNTLRFSLPDASEKSVAQTWEKLSDSRYNALLSSCLELRNRLNLSDWGYLQMLKMFSEKFLGNESNESVLLQMYVLTQSGYKVRIARATGDRLVLLIPSQETLYYYPYLTISGKNYYAINKNSKGQSYYIFNHEFPKEQYFSWQNQQPQLMENLTPPKIFSTTFPAEITVSIQINQNLMDFYDDYPRTSAWNLYVRAGLSETVKQTLYPALQNAIAGKSQTEAAEILLGFLQFAFDYKTCAEQFGYERPFFPDENFFFPYNNCKHRATLYALLVKELLDLEVVLLHYPGHLSTAVHFPENVTGDYINVEGKKFTICDPTYIGASIGMTMNKFKSTSAEVIKM